MGYKVLGFVVWQGARLYARSQFKGARRKFAITAITVAVVGGVLAAGKSAAAGGTPN